MATPLAVCLACSLLSSAIAEQPEPKGQLDPWTFRQQVHAIDRFEILSSRLALARSRNPRVQAFARRMIRDYTMTDAALAAISPAPAADETASAIDARRQALLDTLASSQGADFDRRYAAAQIASNEEALRLFTNQAQTGSDSSLRSFGRQMLLKLQEREAFALGLP